MILQILLDEPLKKQMDKFLNGFFDRWASLRNLRNSIIHSNNKYITKIKISTVNKLIEESYTVFAQLKSNLYKRKRLITTTLNYILTMFSIEKQTTSWYNIYVCTIYNYYNLGQHIFVRPKPNRLLYGLAFLL